MRKALRSHICLNFYLALINMKNFMKFLISKLSESYLTCDTKWKLILKGNTPTTKSLQYILMIFYNEICGFLLSKKVLPVTNIWICARCTCVESHDFGEKSPKMIRFCLILVYLKHHEILNSDDLNQSVSNSVPVTQEPKRSKLEWLQNSKLFGSHLMFKIFLNMLFYDYGKFHHRKNWN